MTALFALVWCVSAASPVEGTLAVLPAHTADGSVVQEHDPLVATVANTARARGLTVVDPAVVRDVIVTLAEQGIRCLDATCFSQVGAFSGAAEVVVPIVTPDRLELRRLQVATGEPVHRVVVDEARTASAVEALLSGAPLQAWLLVEGPPGAAVVVDGIERTTLPLQESLGVTPGRHTVCAATADGACGEEITLQLVDGETRSLVLHPPPAAATPPATRAPSTQAPPPPTPTADTPPHSVDLQGDESPPWVLYAGAGVLAGGLALGAGGAAVAAAGYGVRFLGYPAVAAPGRLAGGLVGDVALATALVVVVGAGLTGGGLVVWGMTARE